MTQQSILATTAAVLLSSVTLAAQATAPPNIAPPQGEQRQPTAAAAEKRIEGCLSAAAAAGAASEGSNAAKFVLRTTPTAGEAETVEYALQPAKPDLKLESYAGHKVEITARPSGTADSLSKPQSNEGVSTSQPSGSTGMETIPPPTGRTLLVSAVRVIAASCQ